MSRKKLCVIGDVHGRTNWQKIDFSQFDRVIFMGDYFDPYAYNISYQERLDNFEKIIELKKAEPHKYILLFGNHDLHYVLDDPREKYSRYDSTFEIQYRAGGMLKQYLEMGYLQIAYTEPFSKLFFIHSALSVRWYNVHILHRLGSVAIEDPVLAVPNSDKARLELEIKLNNLPLETFCFDGSHWDCYGYDVTQGPLWWRCFTEDHQGVWEGEILRGIYQVVGHTQVEELSNFSCDNGARVAFVDLLGQDKYTIIEQFPEGGLLFAEQYINQ